MEVLLLCRNYIFVKPKAKFCFSFMFCKKNPRYASYWAQLTRHGTKMCLFSFDLPVTRINASAFSNVTHSKRKMCRSARQKSLNNKWVLFISSAALRWNTFWFFFQTCNDQGCGGHFSGRSYWSARSFHRVKSNVSKWSASLFIDLAEVSWWRFWLGALCSPQPVAIISTPATLHTAALLALATTDWVWTMTKIVPALFG